MHLPLFHLLTRAALRTRGARPTRHRAGPVTLRVYRAGSAGAEPWVLLHGLGSTALSWWRAIPSVRDRAELWIPELSALGGTRAPHGGLNVREGVAAIGDLIERRVGRPVGIAGISLGGWIAAHLALERPRWVERLVLVDPAGYLDQDWEAVRKLVEVRDLNDAARLQEALFHRPPALIRWLRPGFLAAYGSPPVRHALETISREDALSAEDLARIHQPTTLVWGERDGLFPPAVGRAMASAIPNARLVLVPDCGHAVQWDCPEALGRALADALADPAGRSPMEVAEWPDPTT